MGNIQTETSGSDFDYKPLSNLVIELNIARRNFRSYPKDHPVIDAAFNKVINCYNMLFNQSNSISIGIARDSLIIGDVVLDKKNIVFQDFAKVLYEHGIGVLILHPGLKPDELRNFNIILGLKREELLNHGGIASVWEKSKIISISIKPIQYDMFNTTEAESVSVNSLQYEQKDLWKLFAQGLIQGTLGSDTSYEELLDDGDVEPEVLAKQLNRQMELSGNDSEISFNNALTMAAQPTVKPDSDHVKQNSIPYSKLAMFVSTLNPELRRKFLSNCFDIKSLSNESAAESFITHFSDVAMFSTIEDIKQDRLNLPSSILSLIQKLSAQESDRQNTNTEKLQNDQEINKKIRDIFCEHESEDFTPESYQSLLKRIISTEHQVPANTAKITEMLSSLNVPILENHTSDIILQLMTLGDDEEHNQLLIDNLSDTYFYLLQTGNYEQLIHIIKQCDSTDIPPSIRVSLRKNYTSRECLEEMLVGLATWGKSKYNYITSLIQLIGEPFIEVLLDRLAVEENLSLRRFLMDRIQEFGSSAREYIIARLADNRWFVLRNLVIILRTTSDSTILEHIRHLMHHSNNRVRHEALRTCLHFQDPGAERQILYDMSSNDRETQLAAINLAERSRSVDVFKKLIAIISKSGLSSIDCELKSAAIQALGEIGKVEALPELAKLLALKSLLNSRQLNKLKMEAVRSLRHYPAQIARPVLIQLSSGSNDIAIQASETLKQLMEKSH